MLKSRGFTLLELMVALVVLGIAVSIAVPSFGGLIDRQRIDSSLDVLLRGLRSARQEAVERNRPVTVAPPAGGWSVGWRVFIDDNANGTFDDGERLLREELQPSPISIHATSSVANYVRFNPQGESELINGGFQAGTFRFCPKDQTREGRLLVMNRVGRLRTASDVIDTSYCGGTS
ncbi:GspH/FimT family pseudopilin [Halopseudomonas nanhaiensis]|uniref:GspH/FimT family pseudopilin n=1 Tax=Halopseudomonas nanhaiensis TaxID=2830842 RepID=UPI001CBDD255|nr:GspH/FimT family pseudopilin [Halopseudomonas nanhaiensis]UAW99018.1 GspH/FimT family pseudopilin [Halopseudomonas nanhaiensis]